MKKNAVKLLISGISLALTAVLFVGVAVAWFAANTSVGGHSGGVDIQYEDGGGSADFVPGDGFGDDNPDALFPGDRIAYRFRLKNETASAKNYVFRFNELFVTYPPADTSALTDYPNAVTAADDYEYYDESAGKWYKYNGLLGHTDEEVLAFYRHFVTAFTNSVMVAVVEDTRTSDGALTAAEIDAAVQTAKTANAFSYLTQVPSYYNAHMGSVGFAGTTEQFLVDGTVENGAVRDPKINDELAAKCPLSAAAGTTAQYVLLVVFDGAVFPETEIGGVKYRMKSSNAFLWQKLSATVVVKENQT